MLKDVSASLAGIICTVETEVGGFLFIRFLDVVFFRTRPFRHFGRLGPESKFAVTLHVEKQETGSSR